MASVSVCVCFILHISVKYDGPMSVPRINVWWCLYHVKYISTGAKISNAIEILNPIENFFQCGWNTIGKIKTDFRRTFF